MRWLYTAIIASSAILMRGEAIGKAVDVSLYGAAPDSGQNSSPSVARAIDFALRHHRSRILFKPGRYDFWPQGAVMRRLFISNHDGVAERAVAISIDHGSGLELDGNGSEFVFHNSMLPIAVSHSDRVTLHNFSIDYASPHIVQAKVVSKNDGFVDLHIDNPASYRVKDDHLFISAEDGSPGSEQVARGSVVFDPEGKWLVAGTGDNWEIDKTTAKRIDRDDVRLFGLTQQTRPGDVLILWNGDRPSPAILVSQSRHIHISRAQVYSAQGMGFIAQYSEDIHLDRFNVILKPGTPYIFRTAADKSSSRTVFSKTCSMTESTCMAPIFESLKNWRPIPLFLSLAIHKHSACPLRFLETPFVLSSPRPLRLMPLPRWRKCIHLTTSISGYASRKHFLRPWRLRTQWRIRHGSLT
jgi:hypothetical protein